MTASGTSATRTFPTCSKTTARIGSGPVGELGLDLRGQLNQDVRGVHVPHDRRKVSLHLQLALHHAAHRVQVAEHDLLPPRVGRADDVPGRGRTLGTNDAAPPAGAVPQTEVAEAVL